MAPTSPPLPWERVARSPEETEACGRELAGLLQAGTAGAMVRLEGELGAGKTTFTRGLAAGLGACADSVHSPSYSLVHLYRDTSGRAVLYHIDLYRVEGVIDLEEIGLEDVFASGLPVAVEWPERLQGSRHRPERDDLQVCFEVTGHDQRRLTVRQLDQDSSW